MNILKILFRKRSVLFYFFPFSLFMQFSQIWIQMSGWTSAYYYYSLFILYLNMDRKIQIFPEALDLILEQKQ